MVDEQELSTTRKIVRGFCALMLIVGIMMVLVWGLVFGIWWDIGLYSVVLMFIGFGSIGTLLYSMPESEGETGPK